MVASFLGSVGAVVHPRACPAVPPSVRHAQILACVLVTPRAVRLVSVDVSESSSSGVLSARDRFEVSRVHAAALLAQVIDHETERSWTDQGFVARAVRPDVATGHDHAAVAGCVEVSQP
jgi:hypothetical protein